MTVIAKRARLALVAIVTGVMLLVGAAAPAWADTSDDLIAVDEALSIAVDAFGTVYSDQSTSLEEVAAAADAFTSAANTAKSDFSGIADRADAAVADYATKFAGHAGKMASGSDAISAAIVAQDENALAQGENDLNAALEAYSTTVDEFNGYLKTAGDPTYIGWLIVLIVAVVLLVLALIFALLTRKQEGLLQPKTDKKGNITQSSLKKMRWMVVLWAGLFVVGAAITFFQVAFAQPDANGEYSFRIFWYPLAAGAILTVVSVVQYFIAASKVRAQGSAVAYDPADPATHGVAAQGEGYQPVPQYDGAVDGAPVAPPVAGAPVPPPAADAPVAPPVPDAPVAPPVADAPVAPPVADAPVAPPVPPASDAPQPSQA
ncbi:hypothetical protein QF046_001962 [Microbacterium sp. W4I4]|uniref:hypothetical protein n=1 Tax=Microbacterium sp. W4I4 TaxID=3042295 RepID=UPI002780DB90|nr:hypothetical protein [Microbacterium sp. W4I4]MDQ0614321.1 hypothetical protein [Microbacterium sp. W4I4]